MQLSSTAWIVRHLAQYDERRARLVRASVANDGWQLPSRVELAPTRDGMTPMAARQQKGITAGYVGRPRELNLGRQPGPLYPILCRLQPAVPVEPPDQPKA